jgi:hypothetical protein
VKDSERQLRQRIGRLTAPEEREAEERAWRVVQAARVGADPVAERRGRLRRRAPQLATGSPTASTRGSSTPRRR